MKKLLLIFILAMIFFEGYSQTEKQELSKDYYLQKSKKQETAGWVLLGAGGAMGIGGVLIANLGDLLSADFEAGAILLSMGVVSGLASIPFFIGSVSNYRKTARLSFIPQNYMYPHPDFSNIQPAMSMKIYL